MYLHFMSFPHIDMTQTVESIPHIRQGLIYIINIMVADNLATHKARAPTTMILNMLDRNDSVPARQRP